MFVQRSNGGRVWVKAAADGNGNLPIRSWPAWEAAAPPAVADLLPPVDRPQVAFTYPSADSMLIEVAVPVEGVIDHSLAQGESNPSELSVIDPRIAGSASDALIFTANRPSSPFAVVVFQKQIDQAFLQTVERKTGMWPLLFSPDGQHSQRLGPLNLSLQELLPDLAQASAGIKAKTVSTGQGSFYAAALPWQFEQQPGFVLALVASQDSALQNIRQTVLAILAVTGLILAFSIGVGIFWVGRFIDPIIALTHAVKAIGLVSRLERDRQPDYRLTAENLRPLAISAPGEIGDLAWAFDVMIGELHYSFDTLEQRVQDRTVELLALQQMLEKQNQRLEKQSFDLGEGNRLLQEEIIERKQVEDALRKNRQTLTEAQRIAHIGSWELDHVDNDLSWSDEIFRIFEIDPEQFGATYEAFLNAVHPYDRAAVERTFTESLNNREPYKIEHRLLMPDGRVKYVLERCETHYADDGNPLYSLGTVQDITERKCMEAELVSQADFQQTILNAICDVGMQMMIIENGRMVHLGNRPLARKFGFTDEEIDAHPSFIDFVHPDDRERVIGYHVSRMAGEAAPSSYELGLVARNGERREYETSVAVVPGTDPVRIVAISKDITERKRMEDALSASEAKHRAVFESSNDGIFLHRIVERDGDTEFILYDLNRKGCELWGYSREDILSGNFDLLAMSDSPYTYEEVTQRNRLAAAGQPQLFDWRLKTPDGSQVWGEVNLHRTRIGDEDFLLAVMRDVSERKQAEDEIRALNASLELRVLDRTEELRRQTSYLRTMIDTLPMMAWFKDTDSRFLVVNQVFALAAARTPNVDDLIGKCDFDFWPREHAEVYRADDAEVMATRQRKAVEEPFVDAHDGAIWIETFKAPVMDEDGRVLGTVGLARDISERKAVEAAREAALAEAERLARLRSEFMARMSHELRTPLNGILGYAQILLGESKLNERQDVMVSVIQQSGEHLLNLINDILDFAKIEAGKQKLSLNDVQLPEFLRNIAGIVSVRAEQKHLAFICDIATDVPGGIRVDEMRLRQVLLNLLSNAVKYTERGQICLRVTVLEPGRLRFKVQDSGIGIETGQLENIFRPFEQAGDSRSQTGGTGLGLVISRELVKLMGSEIFVTSRIGEGSTFWFDLDVPVIDVYGEMMPVKQHATGYRGARRYVLVVDDVDVNRALLVNMVSHLGFETVEAANGRACLDTVAYRLPDLVLLDMVMPEMDGLEVARRLRSLPGFGQTPIIAVSASASGTDIAEAMDAGVNVFLSKPIEIKKLMAQIGGLLKLDWIYALPEAEPLPQHKPDEWLDAPPLAEMRILLQLAEEGSMRDIIVQADYLGELDASYRPFVEQLRSLAKGYQSKAVLDLVERYINRNND
jgi:PAS domain S-box-containing protein